MSDLKEAIDTVQRSIAYATFHDDSDEAIELWRIWHIVKGAAGGACVDRNPLDWTEEVRQSAYLRAAVRKVCGEMRDYGGRLNAGTIDNIPERIEAALDKMAAALERAMEGK